MTGNSNSGRLTFQEEVERKLKSKAMSIYVAAAPRMAQMLIDKALEGDRDSAIYVSDRVFGRPRIVSDLQIHEDRSALALKLAELLIAAGQGAQAALGQAAQLTAPESQEGDNGQ